MINCDNPAIINETESINRLKKIPRPWAKDYYAFFSSWLGAIIYEPWLMNIPIDDHAFHRGDGVFEMIKCINGHIYQFDRHLERLISSAYAIHLPLPIELTSLKHLGIAVIKAAGQPNCALRIYITRGPGGFTTNPQECPKSGIYIIASKLYTPSIQAYINGVRIGISSIPKKNNIYTPIKSCSYLPNVILKTEALHQGWDYAIGLDENGNLTEGSSENLGLVDQKNRLILPMSNYILEGLTVRRIKELAHKLIINGMLKSIEYRTLSIKDLHYANEVMLFSTSLDVLPVTYLEDYPVGKGKVGPIACQLLQDIRKDLADNSNMSTIVNFSTSNPPISIKHF